MTNRLDDEVVHVVGVSRLVWGDYGPRPVGEARSREQHWDLVERDGAERLGDASRLRIYSFVLYEDCGDGRSKIAEMVAYGDDDALRASVDELWVSA